MCSSANRRRIAVYGNSATSLKQIVIIQNELYNLKLGASEAMAINENVDGFRITQNIVHDNNNIGIDIIGFEGIAPNPAQDQARNGVIQAAGITLGGNDEDRRRTENCIIKENKLTENNAKHLGYGEINLAFDTRNNELHSDLN
ncbi:hypothetical protein [Paenibacillus solani]|uniref:hypothetical protein n=1 Tax=Paenibacillus solani TaxID=1705565 RepID=UPI003D2BE69A